MSKRIVIAGGSGFIGQALTPVLVGSGFDAVILTRQPVRGSKIRQEQWDGRNVGGWVETLEGAEAIVNLTGRSINCRHTAANRKEILDSRVQSVELLGEAIARCNHPPRVFVQASGVGIYGDQGDRWCDEDAPEGDNFPAEVCKAWERAFAEIATNRTRKVVLRLGVVLGPDGGLLGVLGKLTRWFLGGHVGNGRQFISWIHIRDVIRMITRSIDDPAIEGPFNANAPNPVSNAEFMRELRRVLHRPWSPPVPKFAARVGSAVMGTEASLAFVSQRCRPRCFLEHQFSFEFPHLRPALQNIYSQP